MRSKRQELPHSARSVHMLAQMTDSQTQNRMGLAEALALVGIIVLLLGAITATYGVSGNGGGVEWGIQVAVDLGFAVVGAGAAYQLSRGTKTQTKQRGAAIGAVILAVSAALVVMELLNQTKIFSSDLAVNVNNYSLNNQGFYTPPTYWSATIGT